MTSDGSPRPRAEGAALERALRARVARGSRRARSRPDGPRPCRLGAALDDAEQDVAAARVSAVGENDGGAGAHLRDLVGEGSSRGVQQGLRRLRLREAPPPRSETPSRAPPRPRRRERRAPQPLQRPLPRGSERSALESAARVRARGARVRAARASRRGQLGATSPSASRAIWRTGVSPWRAAASRASPPSTASASASATAAWARARSRSRSGDAESGRPPPARGARRACGGPDRGARIVAPPARDARYREAQRSGCGGAGESRTPLLATPPAPALLSEAAPAAAARVVGSSGSFRRAACSACSAGGSAGTSLRCRPRSSDRRGSALGLYGYTHTCRIPCRPPLRRSRCRRCSSSTRVVLATIFVALAVRHTEGALKGRRTRGIFTTRDRGAIRRERDAHRVVRAPLGLSLRLAVEDRAVTPRLRDVAQPVAVGRAVRRGLALVTNTGLTPGEGDGEREQADAQKTHWRADSMSEAPRFARAFDTR